MPSPRYLFGSGVSDFAIAPPSRHGGFVVSAPSLGNGTLWSAEVGGSQYTDLQTSGGGATTTVSTNEDGALVPFYGPPGIDGAWLDFGGGSRALITATRGQDEHLAGLVTDSLSQAGAALLAAYGRQESIRYSKDFGLLGNGTNEFANLRTFLQTGGTLVFEKGKTYSYTPTTQIVIPAGTTIIFNDSTLYELTSADGYWFKISSDTVIDKMEVSIAGNVATRGVNIQGDNITIGSLKVTARAWDASFASLNRQGLSMGLRTGDSGTPHQNIRIGHLELSGWQHAAGLYNCDGVVIDNVKLIGAYQGIYICDSKNVTIHNGHSSVESPYIKGNPGENTIIVESVAANDSTSDIYIKNFKSMVSGEHGYRLGGLLTMKNVTFENCYATQAGKGVATGIDPDHHGGCGFKALGPTVILNGSATHDNIRFLNCTVESLASPPGTDVGNFVGFQIGKCNNVQITNPIVRGAQDRTTYVDAAYAAYDGIRIIGSSNVTISNPHISNCQNAGIIFYDQNPASYNWGGGCTYVNVIGGVLRNNVYGFMFQMLWGEILRSIRIEGTAIENGTHSIYMDPASPAGALLAPCSARFATKGNSVANVAGTLTNLSIEMQGAEVGSLSGVADGSTITTNSTRRIKQRGTWFYIDPSGTTAARPTAGLSTGQYYYDTTLAKPIWFKQFSPSTWIDAAGNVV